MNFSSYGFGGEIKHMCEALGMGLAAKHTYTPKKNIKLNLQTKLFPNKVRIYFPNRLINAQATSFSLFMSTFLLQSWLGGASK
jgi:hypothetical protein